MATVRRERIIDHPADAVWEILSQPEGLATWFPGVVSCSYEPSDQPEVIGVRRVTTGTGLSLEEEIITIDPLLRRFQYRISGGVLQHHLATVDVIEIDADRCMAVYGTDAEPAVMALVLGGASGEGLDNAAKMLER